MADEGQAAKNTESVDEAKQSDHVEYLTELLFHPDLQVRWKAAEALGEIRDPRSVEPLIQALQDPFVDVTWIAAQALG